MPCLLASDPRVRRTIRVDERGSQENAVTLRERRVSRFSIFSCFASLTISRPNSVASNCALDQLCQTKKEENDGYKAGMKHFFASGRGGAG